VSEPGADHPFRHRLRRMREHALKNRSAVLRPPQADVALECGWGRLLFGQTFREPRDLIQAIRAEAPDCRDIAFYVPDAHVLIALAPQELFLDPSHTFRLELDTYQRAERGFPGFSVSAPASSAEAEGMALVWAARHMVPAPPTFVWEHRDDPAISYLLARDAGNGRVIGAVMGVDHGAAFGDPEHGSSLWCLAVDPQATQPAWARRWCGAWRSTMRRAAAPTWTCRCCTITPRPSRCTRSWASIACPSSPSSGRTRSTRSCSPDRARSTG
jgi:ribosomal protein S18 acetylase RimI-like enzyme